MEPCQLEGRRNRKELAYSFVFVSLTTMVACTHLEHAYRRNKSRSAIIGLLLLVQCCPISPIYELPESVVDRPIAKKGNCVAEELGETSIGKLYR